MIVKFSTTCVTITQNPQSNGSLSDASLVKMSITLSSKQVFLEKCSLYFLINLFVASEPSSEKAFKPCPEFRSLSISSEWANS